MSLTKKEMIEKLIKEADLDRNTAIRSLDAMIELMKSSLTSGDDVMISGFGKFSVNEKNERNGRNPNTGENMLLSARKRVDFKCSEKLRERMNGKDIRNLFI